VTENPEQPRPRDGWPAQPPRYTRGAGAQAWSGQAGYAQGTFAEAGYEQDGYGHGGHGQGTAHDQGGYGQAGYPQGGYLRDGYLRDGTGRRAPRARRRRRGWIALLSTLVALAVLLVIGDQVARAYAQNMIASKLQSSDGLSAKPDVTIEGFPFLTQLAARDIRTIDISASNVQAGKLDISSVKATATGVHITSGFNGATIDHISGTALITFGGLVNAAGAQGVTITADPKAGPNSATVSVGPFSVTAQILQTGPSQITVKIENLPSVAAALIGQLPDYTINVPRLPAGLQLQGVSVTSQGVSISVAAQNTTLSQ
jgi:hypothetical protein